MRLINLNLLLESNAVSAFADKRDGEGGVDSCLSAIALSKDVLK